MSNIKPIYVSNFVNKDDSEKIFFELLNLSWEEKRNARKEYFMGLNNEIYKYDNQTYIANNFIDSTKLLLHMINSHFTLNLNLCFLNRYENQFNSLGWHFDANIASGGHDIPAGPIVVISFGANREIWWKEKSYKGKVPLANRQLLENGSVFLMPSGFQEKYLHKIPKHDKPCGVRISLTFRNFEN